MVTPEIIPDKWLKKLHEKRRLVLARKCYYELFLNRYKRFNTTIEIVLALTSGTVLTLGIWNLLFPQQIKLYLVAIATLITVVIGILKPILRLSDKIDENRVLLENYKRGFEGFSELASIIEKDKLLTVEEFKKMYATISRVIGETGPDEDKLGRFYNKRVNKMLPEDSWKISYISTKTVFSARERNEP